MQAILTSQDAKCRRFANNMIAALRQAGQKGSIHYEPSSFELQFGDDPSTAKRMNLGNAFDLCCSLPLEQRQDAISNYAKAMCALDQETKTKPSFDKARDCLMPKIHARSVYENEPSSGAGADKATASWHKPIGDHLAAGIGYDLPSGIMAIDNRDLAKWGVSGEEAFAIACENLRRRSTEPFDTPAPGVFVSPWNDDYGSSRLVLTDLIRDLEVKGNHVAITPDRDTLIVTGSEDPVGLNAMLDIAKEAFERPYPVSGIPVLLRDGKWESFEPDKHYTDLEGFRTLRLQSLESACSQQKTAIESRRDSGDEFVASYFLVTPDRCELPTSFTVWSSGIKSLLPRTEKIVFVRSDRVQGKEIVACADWERVQNVVGDLMKPMDLYPQRFSVEKFPTDEQLKELGFAPEFKGLASR